MPLGQPQVQKVRRLLCREVLGPPFLERQKKRRSMRFSLRCIIPLTLSAVTVSCGDSGSSDELVLPEVDCSSDIPAFDEVTAFSDVCTNCHNSALEGTARRRAPEGIDFDQYESARAHARRATSEVFVGNMPPQGTGFSLTTDQEETLYKWALCGAPE